MTVENELREHEERIGRLETCVGDIKESLGKLTGSSDTIKMLIQWVVLPLLMIMAGLVGIKLVIPGV